MFFTGEAVCFAVRMQKLHLPTRTQFSTYLVISIFLQTLCHAGTAGSEVFRPTGFSISTKCDLSDAEQ